MLMVATMSDFSIYSNEQIQALKDALSKGVRTVSYGDRSVTYGSAEKLITKTIRGFPKHEWTLTRARNEALDCRIYCLAALNAIGVYRYQDQHWDAIEKELRL